jgi:hypothetical protein
METVFLQEDFIDKPDIILHPFPPQVTHSDDTKTCTSKCHYEPRHHQGYSHHPRERQGKNSYSGKFIILLTNEAPNRFPKLNVSKLVNVPRNKTNPANKIQVKNEAARSYSIVISSNAGSIFIYCDQDKGDILLYSAFSSMTVCSNFDGRCFNVEPSLRAEADFGSKDSSEEQDDLLG